MSDIFKLSSMTKLSVNFRKLLPWLIFTVLDFEYEGSTLHGLRSELYSVVERSRLNDKKQVELEQSMTRMEEELSGKTVQIVELNDRIADKMSLVTLLENKLLKRNDRVIELQKEIEIITGDQEEVELEV